MDTKTIGRIRNILDGARSDARNALYETEGLDLLDALGFRVPHRTVVSGPGDIDSVDLSRFEGDRVVVKVVSHEILHKSDVGGVEVVGKNHVAVAAAVERIRASIRDGAGSGAEGGIAGYSINRFLDYDRSPGGELLLGLRWTDDFGPVVVLGFGGVQAESLARHFKPGREIALFSPLVPPISGVGAALTKSAVAQLASWGNRGRPPKVSLDRLVDACNRLSRFAEEFCPVPVTDLEINPLVVSGGDLWALDALARLRYDGRPTPPPRPVSRIRALLEPETIAIVGVSGRVLNPGRVILQNTLRAGFDPQRIYLVKPGSDRIDGCKCYPDIRSLPGRVDLAVLAIGASAIPRAVADIVDGEKAESAIVIPGGMEEKAGGRKITERLKKRMETSRKSAWGGPVLNGGNSLGVRSRPGRYDTIFIPRHKLGLRAVENDRAAFVSQSGAFAVAQGSKLSSVGMRYTVSIGNQMDLTVGDYLEYLEGDRRVEVYAVYVEGFRYLDGRSFLRSARKITESGRTVVLYAGGRSEAGAHAAASHTASVAGNYAITRELAAGCGVVVADTVADFEDLVKLFDAMSGRTVRGLRLGGLSNAGFECVALADNLRGFRFEPFTAGTQRYLEGVFRSAGIDSIVDVHNPLDLTPMSGDATYEDAMRSVLGDDNVDVCVFGCVPHTARLKTLPRSEQHDEDLDDEEGVVPRMVRLYNDSKKPWIAVVDGGPAYHAMRRKLAEGGVPTFTTADRALRLFSVFCESRLRHSHNFQPR